MDPSMLDPSMIVRPRPKRSVLPPPSKKRRTNNSAIDEIAFDFDARADYLTGFHKRKVQRAKAAQEQAAKLEREEKISLRKQLREERKQELEEHVEAVNRALRSVTVPGLDGEPADSSEEEWGGIEDTDEQVNVIDHEEEYVDEERYTTVTVEEVDVSKEGLHKVADEESVETLKVEPKKEAKTEKKAWPKKLRKQKFRYESKAERKFTRGKQKASNKSKADARRGND